MVYLSINDRISRGKVINGIVTYYTYILQCQDDTYYTGWTNDLYKRLYAHNKGKASRYTRGRLPVMLVYYESFLTNEDAMRREYQIKQLSRIQKLALIHS